MSLQPEVPPPRPPPPPPPIPHKKPDAREPAAPLEPPPGATIPITIEDLILVPE
jgi:hypothetical protein